MIDIFGTRKTRRGWLGKRIKENYLRDDISCGISYCTDHSQHIQMFELQQHVLNTIYFIDYESLSSHIDIIQNSSKISNLVVIQSIAEEMKIKKPQTYNQLKNLSESSTNKVLYIFPNKYHANCAVESSVNEEKKPIESLLRSARWYQQHIKENKFTIEIQVLTSNFQIQKRCDEEGIKAVGLMDFVQEFDSNLLDFLGFSQISTEKMFQNKVYHEHPEHNEIIERIKKGVYIEGKFMNERSYVKLGGETFPVLLQNNRAIYGDVIAVELDEEAKWLKNVFQLAEKEQETAEAHVELESINVNLLNKLKKSKKTPTGRVVGIVKRALRNYCGTVIDNCLQKLQNNIEIYEFTPVDPRYPNFYLKTRDFKSLENKRIVIAFDQWPSHSKQPLGHFKRVIGEVGDAKTEGDVILLEHNVEIAPFSKAVYDCLPSQGDKYVIPQKQIDKRMDLRHLNVVSIDPPGCRDIDDALHCYKLRNGNYNVGVHIADVSHFVRPDTAIDKEASHRCTTVYLVDRRTDMLPKLLTEDLCSLRDKVDRLVFSTIWEMDAKANIISTTYSKCIIQSRKAFTYADAQNLIENKNDNSEIAQSVRQLNILAKQIKQRRLDKGALQLASTQVKFSFDQETHNATDIQLYNLLETNSLIEEFMLLSNISVAEKIVERFPSISILRHHTPPKFKQLQEFKTILQSQGFQLNFETSKDLAESLDKLNRPGDEFFNKLMRILTTRCMNEATYFCSADYDLEEFYHYGLAAGLYTHFTSPIRRYADVLVHRLLAASIDVEPLPKYMSNKLKMGRICDKMNMRHRMARFASRASSDYTIYLFFKNMKEEERKSKGIITTVTRDSFTVMLPKYGLECSVKFSPEDIERNSNNESHKFFYRGKEHKIFDYLSVRVSIQLKGFHKSILLEVLE